MQVCLWFPAVFPSSVVFIDINGCFGNKSQLYSWIAFTSSPLSAYCLFVCLFWGSVCLFVWLVGWLVSDCGCGFVVVLFGFCLFVVVAYVVVDVVVVLTTENSREGGKLQ